MTRLYHPSSQADDDATMGMAWWNACSQAARARWLAAADSAIPAQAWDRFKRSSALPSNQTPGAHLTTQTKAGAMLSALGDIQ